MRCATDFIFSQDNRIITDIKNMTYEKRCCDIFPCCESIRVAGLLQIICMICIGYLKSHAHCKSSIRCIGYNDETIFCCRLLLNCFVNFVILAVSLLIVQYVVDDQQMFLVHVAASVVTTCYRYSTTNRSV